MKKKTFYNIYLQMINEFGDIASFNPELKKKMVALSKTRAAF